jgi:hypothetical protein
MYLFPFIIYYNRNLQDWVKPTRIALKTTEASHQVTPEAEAVRHVLN